MTNMQFVIACLSFVIAFITAQTQGHMPGINPRILSLIDELDDLRQSRDDHWQIPRLEGEMLHQIALASGAKKIVEIGTSYGFSGLWWGAALQETGGQLHTIDISRKKY